MEKSATIEVVCDGTTEEFETATAPTGRYKELQDAGKSPELFVVTRRKILL